MQSEWLWHSGEEEIIEWGRPGPAESARKDEEGSERVNYTLTAVEPLEYLNQEMGMI